jgi:hypothetical protein
MQSTDVETNETVPGKILAPPVTAGTAVAGGAETAGHDLAQGVGEVAAVVVEGTKTIVRVIVESAEQLGRDAKPAVDPTPEPRMTATNPPAAAAV